MTRRNLKPPPSVPGEVHGQRRGLGGARHENSERIALRQGSSLVEGWTLNASRGGVRIIVEDPLELGGIYGLTIGDADPLPGRPGKVMWVQDEADGQICGVKFLDTDEPAPPQTGTASARANEP